MRTLFTFLLAAICVVGYAQKKPKINQALSAMEDGDYATAKSIIDQAIVHEKTKDDAKTWYYRGQIYAALDTATNEQGALEEALKAFDKALEIDPEQKSINSVDFNTGSIENVDSKRQGYYSYYYNQAITDYNNESFDSSADNFETAYYIMPSDTNAILNAAYAAGAAGDDERSMTNFRKSMDAGVKDRTMFLQLYNYNVTNEQYDEGLVIIQKAREVYPEDVDLMRYEINLYLQLDRVDEAQKGLEEAIVADPENPDLLFSLGVLKDETGDTEGAKEAYNRAIGIDPNHFNSNFNLGVLAYNKVSELVKEQSSLNYYPGKSRPDPKEKKKYEELDAQIQVRLKESLPIWEKCYSIDSTDINVLQTLGYIYKALGNTQQFNKIDAELKAIQGN